ncbi:MAG: carbon storage regulator [Amphritea sp.]
MYLDRRVGESLIIGNDVIVKYLGSDPNGETIIGIEAPPEITVDRKEIYNKKKNCKPAPPVIRYKKRRSVIGN